MEAEAEAELILLAPEAMVAMVEEVEVLGDLVEVLAEQVLIMALVAVLVPAGPAEQIVAVVAQEAEEKHPHLVVTVARGILL
jgi:uncharacterized ion transporter superfamily protein YfcC